MRIIRPILIATKYSIFPWVIYLSTNVLRDHFQERIGNTEAENRARNSHCTSKRPDYTQFSYRHCRTEHSRDEAKSQEETMAGLV